MNDFMRNDIKFKATNDELKNVLVKLTKEMNNIINSDDTLNVLKNNITNWPYKIKEYSIKDLVREGIRYDTSKLVKFEKKGNKAFLISRDNVVEIPNQFIEILARHKGGNKEARQEGSVHARPRRAENAGTETPSAHGAGPEASPPEER